MHNRVRSFTTFSLLVMLSVVSSVQAQTFFGLLDAGMQNFAVVNLGGKFQFDSNANSTLRTITGANGNVGLEQGSGANISVLPNTTASGKLFLGPGLATPTGSNAFAGGVVQNDARLGTSGSVVLHAYASASGLNALLSDQFMTLSNSPNTIVATHSGQNVIHITGDIRNMTTLSAGGFSNVTFVVNVGGQIQLSEGNGLLLGSGLNDWDAIYNVTGNVSTAGENSLQISHGILLAANSNIQWRAGQLNGELIGRSVEIGTGGRVNNTYFGPVSVPETGAFAMLISAGFVGAIFKLRRGTRI